MANILVIDDDKDIQRLLEFALKRAGHTVDMAYDGEQGLAHAKEYQPDLIVCDVMMPKMTGYEFCHQARASSTLKHTPIIVFSARFQPIDKQTALEAGATDYMSKSTAPDTLVARVTELLPTKKPKTAAGMIAVFSLRGGVGATSLSVNLSAAMAKLHNVPVSLVDLVALSGHAALMMGLRPTKNIAKLLASTNDNFSPEIANEFLIKHQSGVQLLASPLAHEEQLSADIDAQLLPLLTGLKSSSAITILDAPHLLESHYSPVLPLIDKVLLVISTDMPSVQSAAIALQGLLKLGVAQGKIMLIVNQVAQLNALPVEVIQKAVKRPVMATIPFDPNMTRAINAGRPLFLVNAESPASIAINQMAGKILA
jgi:CheY-like chemotaxis protein/MinD-like ATPase involved in chromosome partitioning or flagellar assembly